MYSKTILQNKYAANKKETILIYSTLMGVIVFEEDDFSYVILTEQHLKARVASSPTSEGQGKPVCGLCDFLM